MTYSCLKYETLPDSKRCIHYVDGGTCTLPGRFICEEWERANAGKLVPKSAMQPLPAKPKKTLPPPREAFSLIVQDSKPVKKAPARQSISTSATLTDPEQVAVDLPERAPLAPIPATDIEAFKALGVEVQLDVGGTHIALVPEYTAADRIELSIEHAATLRRLLDVFPGARIAKLGRSTNQEGAANGQG
jgi:hypothetical protein